MPQHGRHAALWRRHGRTDPYYGVLNTDAFRGEQLDRPARDAFFASGEADVARTLDAIRRHVAPGFRPTRALDFGCGVGRLVIPLARVAEEVVGVDVAPEMIAEAQRNCAAFGVANARFALSDPRLSAVDGTFDLVHSYIVFQHIPPAQGEPILHALLERLRAGGVGALHFTYARRAPWWRRTVHWLRRSVPPTNAAVNLLQGRPAGAPMFPMYEYRLDRLLDALRDHGCASIHARLTDHGGHLGAVLSFRKGDAPVVGEPTERPA
jgi:SAM-dependent methyltransferase